MQDMKKIRFSSQKNNIFYYVSLENLLFEKQKKDSFGTNQIMHNRVGKKKVKIMINESI